MYIEPCTLGTALRYIFKYALGKHGEVFKAVVRQPDGTLAFETDPTMWCSPEERALHANTPMQRVGSAVPQEALAWLVQGNPLLMISHTPFVIDLQEPAKRHGKRMKREKSLNAPRGQIPKYKRENLRVRESASWAGPPLMQRGLGQHDSQTRPHVLASRYVLLTRVLTSYPELRRRSPRLRPLC